MIDRAVDRKKVKFLSVRLSYHGNKIRKAFKLIRSILLQALGASFTCMPTLLFEKIKSK